MRTKRVLIVDDEPRSRNGLKRRLETWEHDLLQVFTASDGPEALHLLQEQDIDVLITDIRMPEMTGLELIAETKSFQRRPVFIVISAYSEFSYAQEALHMGVVNYLLKPVKKEAFLDAVQEALETRYRLDQIERVDRAFQEPDRIPSDQLPEPLQEAAAYIDSRISEKFSLKEVAREVHLNPSYLSVLFKEHMTMTFSEYVTKKRLQLAKRLLLTTSLPITEIAEQTGYQTSKYFIRIFREHEGLTPSRYRRESSTDVEK
ncbi:response regulator transcription factor [Alkalicoccus luteus]|uniref:Response regulator n=1 Tax=Alkalicoccus luteus TaxID=1237094 RepID=A0A969PST6_9BACI|nr:response regulator [Alkalicoccus luteus]NJP37726.1 response regulator [Alkalicoccus luteus]